LAAALSVKISGAGISVLGVCSATAVMVDGSKDKSDDPIGGIGSGKPNDKAALAGRLCVQTA
jgi:hypothetical protein